MFLTCHHAHNKTSPPLFKKKHGVVFSQPRKPHSLWPSKSLTTHHDHLNGREKNIGATELRCFVSGSRSEPLNLKVWRFEAVLKWVGLSSTTQLVEHMRKSNWMISSNFQGRQFQKSLKPPSISVRFRESLKLISARMKMRDGLKHWNHHTIPIVPIRDPLDRPLFFDARDSSVKRLELIKRITGLTLGKSMIRKNRELLSIRYCYCNPLDGFDFFNMSTRVRTLQTYRWTTHVYIVYFVSSTKINGN